MRSEGAEDRRLRRSIERHYDSLATLYRIFWGEHIHHGLWLTAEDSPRRAQEQLVAYLADAAQVDVGELVVDVGCGYGASGRWLVRRRGCRSAGLTISRTQARFARHRNRRLGLVAHASVIRADAARLPLSDRSADVVWVVECLEHLPEKAEFLQQVKRVLRPGGRLALCSWQRTEAVPPDDPRVREVCSAFHCPSLASAREYRDWCDRAGLSVRRQEDLTSRVRATWDILLRRIRRPWLRPLRWVVASHVRRFVDGFPAIGRAYDAGIMSYGLLIARRP